VFVRQQLFRPAAAAASVAVAMAVCGGSGAAAARTGTGPAASSATSATAATAQNCVTVINLGPNQSRSSQQAGWRRVTRAGVAVLPSASAGAGRPASRPTGPTYTVTVTGTNIAGGPAGGLNDVAYLFNADDSTRFDSFATSLQHFTHGVAKFHVPAGHYWALGDFIKPLPRQQSWDEYLDVLPQFTVTGNTTVHLAAAAATSQVRAAVARPVTTQYLTFQLIRSAAAGPPVSIGWMLNDGGPKIPAPALYVSPTSASPTVGKLATVTSLQLGPAAFQSDSRYIYNLAYQSSGIIPPQGHVVNQAALATSHLRYYSAPTSDGLSVTFPVFPVNNQVCQLGGAIFGGMRFPAEQTEYLQAGSPLSWQTQFIQNEAQDFSGGQIGPWQSFLPGQVETQDFGAFPLHPAPNVPLSYIPGQPPTQVSAGRAGNTLRLAMTAFSDSVPGHVAQGTFPPVHTAASYEIDQNGTKIAGGAVPNFTGPFAATAALSSAPSTIRVSLNAAESAKLSPLSTASSTVWTWRSAPAPGATLPADWTCLPGGAANRACAVQPMMTLRYGVVGLGLDGSTAPGQQVVRLQVGHLPLARPTKITAAAVSVSFDGGKTWRAARLTGGGGSYAAVFSALPGALVTLRTRASDAAGGSVTETITNAYRIGS
jgi:hypothetical protein